MLHTTSSHIVVGPATESSTRHDPSFSKAEGITKEAVELSHADNDISGSYTVEGEVVPMVDHSSRFRFTGSRDREAGEEHSLLSPTRISTSCVAGNDSASSLTSSPPFSSLPSHLCDPDTPSTTLGSLSCIRSNTVSPYLVDHTHPSRHEETSGVTVSDDGCTASPRSTKSLSLIHQNITALRHLKDLPTLRSLLALRLHMNHIRIIEPGIFKSLSVLEELDMSANDLTCLGDEALVGLGRLRRLDLSGNAIQTLSRQCFAPLAGLQWLTLAFNELRDIDAVHSLPSSSHLFYLNIAGNHIPHLHQVERALSKQKGYLTTLCLRVLLPTKEGVSTDRQKDIQEGEEDPNTPPFFSCRENPFVTHPTGASSTTSVRSTTSTASPSWYVHRIVDAFPSLVLLDDHRVAVDPLREALQQQHEKRNLPRVAYANGGGAAKDNERGARDGLPRQGSTGDGECRKEEGARPSPPLSPSFYGSLPSLTASSSSSPSRPSRTTSMPRHTAATATAWRVFPPRQRAWSIPRKPSPIPRPMPSPGRSECGLGRGKDGGATTMRKGMEESVRRAASPSARHASDTGMAEPPHRKKEKQAARKSSSTHATSLFAGGCEGDKDAHTRESKRHRRRSHASEAEHETPPPKPPKDVDVGKRCPSSTPRRCASSTRKRETREANQYHTPTTPHPSSPPSPSSSSSSSASFPSTRGPPSNSSRPSRGASTSTVRTHRLLAQPPSSTPTEEEMPAVDVDCTATPDTCPSGRAKTQHTEKDPPDKPSDERREAHAPTPRVSLSPTRIAKATTPSPDTEEEERRNTSDRPIAERNATVTSLPQQWQASWMAMAQQRLSLEASMATAACREKDLQAQVEALRNELSRKGQEAVVVRKHLTAAFQGEQRQAAVWYQRRLDALRTSFQEQWQHKLHAAQEEWKAQQGKERQALVEAMQERETQWNAIRSRDAAAASQAEHLWHRRWQQWQQRVALAEEESDARAALVWQWGSSVLLAPAATRRVCAWMDHTGAEEASPPGQRSRGGGGDVSPFPTDVRGWIHEWYRTIRMEKQQVQKEAQQAYTQHVAFLEAQRRNERKRWAEEKRAVYDRIEEERIALGASWKAVHAEMEGKLHSLQQRLAEQEEKGRTHSIDGREKNGPASSPSSLDSVPSFPLSSPLATEVRLPSHETGAEDGRFGGAPPMTRVDTDSTIRPQRHPSVSAAATPAGESDVAAMGGGTSPIIPPPETASDATTPSAALPRPHAATLADGTASALPLSSSSSAVWPWEHTLQQLYTVCDVLMDTQRGLYKENDRLLLQVREWEDRFQQSKKETYARMEELQKTHERMMATTQRELAEVSVDREALQREVHNLRADVGQKRTLLQELEEEAMHKLDEKRQRIATLEEELDPLREQVKKGTALSAEYRELWETQQQQLQRLESGVKGVFSFAMADGGRQRASDRAPRSTGREVQTPIRHSSGSPTRSTGFFRRPRHEEEEEEEEKDHHREAATRESTAPTTTTTNRNENSVITGSTKPIHVERIILQVEELAAQLEVSQQRVEHYQTEQQEFVVALRRARNDLSCLVNKIDVLEREKVEERRRIEIKDEEILRLREKIMCIDQQSKEKQVATLEAVAQMMKAGL